MSIEPALWNHYAQQTKNYRSKIKIPARQSTISQQSSQNQPETDVRDPMAQRHCLEHARYGQGEMPVFQNITLSSL